MDDLIIAGRHITVAQDEHDRDYEKSIAAKNESESMLTERMAKLNRWKKNAAATYGIIFAANDDLMHVDAGAKVISAERSTLTQL
jgi:hypothetical protein